MAFKRDKSDINKSTTKCAVAKRCGGCDYIEIDYKKQLEKKQETAKKYLAKFGKVEEIVPMEKPYHYRNKVSAAFGFMRGQVIAGTYEKKSHNIVDIQNCLIEDKKASAIVATIKELCKSFKIKTYNEDTGYGLLRHTLIRVGKATNEVMVVLVTASPIFPGKNNFVKALKRAHPEITTIVQNINPRGTSMVLGDRNETLFGRGYIEDVLCGLTFRISPKSFYQVNPVQTEKLYRFAIDCADFTGEEVVLDAYAGVGTIGLIAASKVKQVISVELNKDAVRDAISNAKRNAIKNITFYAQDATALIVAAAENGEKIDTIIMDPPRSGSTPEFIAAIRKLSPKRVIYVSCNPETLARDLEVFVKYKYKAKKIQPFDCFSQTAHLETVVLLSKLEVNQQTSIEVGL